MFTGIVEEIGTVKNILSSAGGIRITISAPASGKHLDINDSVSINGVCQTVIAHYGTTFDVEAVEETLKKTTLGSLRTSDSVNVELPMRLNDRLDGHLVLGHVDAVGQVTDIEQRESSWMFTVCVPDHFAKYLVLTGSIAVDGISLTIAEVYENIIRVSIIPHTMAKTIMKSYTIGTTVNVEFDIVGKYIERQTTLLHPPRSTNFFSKEQLTEMGY